MYQYNTLKKGNETNNKLIIGITIGLVIGLVIGIVFSVALDFPNLTTQPNSVDYTSVKVLSHGVEYPNVGGEKFTISYKWWGQGATTDEGEYTDSPIEISVLGSDIERILPPIQDRTYNIAGIEVKVSDFNLQVKLKNKS